MMNTRTPPTLSAALATPPSTVQLSASLITASVSTRSIDGPICEYGAIGYTTAGPTIFERGSLAVPDPITKAKLLVQHNQEAAAVGLMASFTDDPRFPRATFSVPDGAAGDEALVNAANGLRDGLSISAHIDQSYYDADGVLHVVKGRIYEVSLVTIPAFENAGVTSVAAAHQEKADPMTREELAAALAAGTITQEDYDTQIAALAASDAEAAAATPPAAQEPAPAAASAAHRQAAPPAPVVTPRRISLSAGAQITVDHIRAHGVQGLSAALSDTVPAGDTGKAFLKRGTFIDEVWQVGQVDRPIIDILGAKPLTGDLIEGYVWGVPPTVPQYTGNKTAVHSEVLTWTPKSMEPIRFAGGWDIDRKYIDLGRAGIIRETYVKAVEDYKRQTEAYAAATLVAGATADGASATLFALFTSLAALTKSVGFKLDFLQLAPALWAEFVNLPEASVPWWLRNQGSVDLGTNGGSAGGIEISVNTSLATRAYLAGDKRAASYYEVDPPVQVYAENIPNGGVDLGVFGYAGLLINDARGLRKGTVTAP